MNVLCIIKHLIIDVEWSTFIIRQTISNLNNEHVDYQGFIVFEMSWKMFCIESQHVTIWGILHYFFVWKYNRSGYYVTRY